MGELFGYTLIAAWFIFWGYILVTKPEVFFEFQKQGNERIDKFLHAGAKVVEKGVQVAAKNRK